MMAETLIGSGIIAMVVLLCLRNIDATLDRIADALEGRDRKP